MEEKYFVTIEQKEDGDWLKIGNSRSATAIKISMIDSEILASFGCQLVAMATEQDDIDVIDKLGLYD